MPDGTYVCQDFLAFSDFASPFPSSLASVSGLVTMNLVGFPGHPHAAMSLPPHCHTPLASWFMNKPKGGEPPWGLAR